jgi:quercetin dioxygenase-like cupin family protein
MTRSFWLLGVRLTVHANHEDTGGRYDLVESVGIPGFRTPWHRHTRYSELVYVLEGEFTVRAGEEMAVLRPGDVFAIPAGTPHTVAVTGSGPARGLVVSSPSGFARLIMAAGTPDLGKPPANPPDLALIDRISAEVGDELFSPPGFEPLP